MPKAFTRRLALFGHRAAQGSARLPVERYQARQESSDLREENLVRV